jgi:dihydrodipicolinate synthase/N-acetylneuraminate lyase
MRTKALKILMSGAVIPAIPLVLHPDRTFDEAGQRRLIRYYLASGAGGLAVAVHTTQFAIRKPGIDLLRPVLETAVSEMIRFEARTERTIVRIAGVCGAKQQAVREAEQAAALGFDAVLLSPGGLVDHSEEMLLSRTKTITQICPVIGFYLQPAVGGRVFSFSYWQKLCEIDGVVAIKVAPFDRYLTLGVLRAAALSSRSSKIALYTGNDDHIVLDLFTDYTFSDNGRQFGVRFSGGLLGQWAVWTSKATELFSQLVKEREEGIISGHWMNLASQITDCNSVIFDAAHHFKGCIAGIHEVLRRQGLIQGIWTLDPEEGLSPGQAAELDRIERQYPHLADNDFVADFLEQDQG